MSNRITDNMHRVNRKDPFLLAVTGAIANKINLADAGSLDFIAQLSIDSATWALSIYEKELGLATNINKPLDDRRSVIKSKFRGSGNVTAEQIKLVADSYTNGDVEVTLVDGITIEFTSVFGVPANMDDLKKALREIIPAHLQINYTFRFVTYKDIKGKTYAEIKAKTYKELLNGGV